MLKFCYVYCAVLGLILLCWCYFVFNGRVFKWVVGLVCMPVNGRVLELLNALDKLVDELELGFGGAFFVRCESIVQPMGEVRRYVGELRVVLSDSPLGCFLDYVGGYLDRFLERYCGALSNFVDLSQVRDVIGRVREAISIVRVSAEYGMMISFLARLEPLLSLYGLNQDWVISVVSLQLLDVAVNRALRRAGFVGDMPESFKDRLTLLTERGCWGFTWLNKLVKMRIWAMRNKIVHGGYVPNEYERDLIINYVIKTVNELNDCGRRGQSV